MESRLDNATLLSILQSELTEWQYENERIKREYKFKDFKQAIAFMVYVSLYCEQKDHHPDWKNVYNTVSVELYTHSINSISTKDIELAKFMENAYKLFRTS